MTKYIIYLVFMLFISACSKTTFDSHDHADEGHSNEESDSHDHGGGEIESIRFTEFSDKYELFAEMTPLINGEETEFVVHYTKLTDYKPITKGSLKIELKGDIDDHILVESIARNGIFLASYIPKSTGIVKISFIYNDGQSSDTINVADQKCYPSMSDAKKDEKHEDDGITFLKEEAWKMDFNVIRIKKEDFFETVKAVGKTLNSPKAEVTIAAPTAGIVEILSNNVVPGNRVTTGAKLFRITSASLMEDNLQLNYSKAKAEYERYKREFDRLSELYELKIVSEKEYLEAKAGFEKAEAKLKNYDNSKDGKAVIAKAEASGYIRDVLIKNGQYVEAGEVLAVIANNDDLMVKVDIPATDYGKLRDISDAFLEVNNDRYSLNELNGKISGEALSSGTSSFVSIYISIENKIGAFPNTLMNVYLKGETHQNSVVIPKESVWEDYGRYFVFVQKHGELFEKREIEIGGYDGANYLILSGLNSNEVIVSKGVYKVMLASKTSELPKHAHVH